MSKSNKVNYLIRGIDSKEWDSFKNKTDNELISIVFRDFIHEVVRGNIIIERGKGYFSNTKFSTKDNL